MISLLKSNLRHLHTSVQKVFFHCVLPIHQAHGLLIQRSSFHHLSALPSLLQSRNTLHRFLERKQNMICFNILTTNSYLWQLKFKAFELRIRMQSIANSYSHDIDLRLPRFSKLPPDIHLKEGFLTFTIKL